MMVITYIKEIPNTQTHNYETIVIEPTNFLTWLESKDNNPIVGDESEKKIKFIRKGSKFNVSCINEGIGKNQVVLTVISNDVYYQDFKEPSFSGKSKHLGSFDSINDDENV
jgi:hypothetical protein